MVSSTEDPTMNRPDFANNANLGLLLYSYGLRSQAQKDQGFNQPTRFLEFARERGANAVQLPLGIRSKEESLEVQRTCEKLMMRIEGIVSPPKDGAADWERFGAELATARACGAAVVRLVMLGGRRYEVFDKAEDFSPFAKRAEESLRRAEPIANAHKVVLYTSI